MGEQAKFLIELALAWFGALYGKTKKPSAVVAAMAASLPANSNYSGRRRSIDASRTAMGDEGYATRGKILEEVNNFLTTTCKIDARVGANVFKASDPLVWVNGKAPKYTDIVGGASQQDARDFWTWFTSDSKTLANLPAHMQAFAVIVCFAEVARGFHGSLESELVPWISDIIGAASEHAAQAIWTDVNRRFKPSTTYAQDHSAAEEWTPLQ